MVPAALDAVLSQRPSEMIEGLDKVGLERPSRGSGRTSGGTLSTNEAIHVDDSGARVARLVRAGVYGSVAIVVGLGAFLVYRSAHRDDDKIAAEQTKARLLRYQDLASRLPTLAPDEVPEAKELRGWFEDLLKERLKSCEAQAVRVQEQRVETDTKVLKALDDAQGDIGLKDAWGREIAIAVRTEEDVVRFLSRGPDGKEGTKDDLMAYARLNREHLSETRTGGTEGPQPDVVVLPPDAKPLPQNPYGPDPVPEPEPEPAPGPPPPPGTPAEQQGTPKDGGKPPAP